MYENNAIHNIELLLLIIQVWDHSTVFKKSTKTMHSISLSILISMKKSINKKHHQVDNRFAVRNQKSLILKIICSDNLWVSNLNNIYIALCIILTSVLLLYWLLLINRARLLTCIIIYSDIFYLTIHHHAESIIIGAPITLLQAVILTGPGKGEITFIPRIPSELPFFFKRLQFYDQARIKGGAKGGMVPGPIDFEGPSLFLKYHELRYLYEKSLQEVFPNILIALRLYLTIPVTNCSAERAFSKLTRIKNKYRTSQTQENLTSLM
ncbi:zinc finger MYM-type protein 1-like, partial [Aphis craccivora]